MILTCPLVAQFVRRLTDPVKITMSIGNLPGTQVSVEEVHREDEADRERCLGAVHEQRDVEHPARKDRATRPPGTTAPGPRRP